VRTLLALILFAYSVAAGGVVHAQPTASRSPKQLAGRGPGRAPAEDASAQVQTVESAYNLMMDRFVHPLSSAELLKSAWDQLSRDAAGKHPIQGRRPTSQVTAAPISTP
jgi:hypothetical protein